MGIFGIHRQRGIAAPVQGVCMRLEDVADQVFATKMMGDGFAIHPDGHTVVSPMDGVIVMIAPTKHAFGIRSKTGVELLIHVGLDTVQLQGAGFQVMKKVNEKVSMGTPILCFDEAFMASKKMDMTTMVIFLDGVDGEVAEHSYGQRVHEGEVLIK